MKCPFRVGKHCAVQALPDICSCRSSSHSCTDTVHWLCERLLSIFGPGYARPHILLQFSGIVLCPSLFDERLNAVNTTEVKNGGSDLLRAYKWWFRIGQSEDGGPDIGGRLPALADPPNDFQHS